MIIENETCALFEFDDEQVSTRMPDKLNVKLPKLVKLGQLMLQKEKHPKRYV